MDDKLLTIAIDVDGVLRDNLGEIVRVYNEEFNDTKTVDDIHTFKIEETFPKVEVLSGMSASQWFFQEHSKEIFVDAKPFENMAEDIKTLQKYGNVIIVTYQKSYLNKMQTLEWLEKHGVNPEGIVFLKDKTHLHSDILIDDNDWNFIGSHACHGILINAPYNKNVNLDELTAKSHCINIKRFNSLHEFVEDFKKQNGE